MTNEVRQQVALFDFIFVLWVMSRNGQSSHRFTELARKKSAISLQLEYVHMNKGRPFLRSSLCHWSSVCCSKENLGNGKFKLIFPLKLPIDWAMNAVECWSDELSDVWVEWQSKKNFTKELADAQGLHLIYFTTWVQVNFAHFSTSPFDILQWQKRWNPYREFRITESFGPNACTNWRCLIATESFVKVSIKTKKMQSSTDLFGLTNDMSICGYHSHSLSVEANGGAWHSLIPLSR